VNGKILANAYAIEITTVSPLLVTGILGKNGIKKIRPSLAMLLKINGEVISAFRSARILMKKHELSSFCQDVAENIQVVKEPQRLASDLWQDEGSEIKGGPPNGDQPARAPFPASTIGRVGIRSGTEDRSSKIERRNSKIEKRQPPITNRSMAP
jgi:hypothetical protein